MPLSPFYDGEPIFLYATFYETRRLCSQKAKIQQAVSGSSLITVRLPAASAWRVSVRTEGVVRPRRFLSPKKLLFFGRIRQTYLSAHFATIRLEIGETNQFGDEVVNTVF